MIQGQILCVPQMHSSILQKSQINAINVTHLKQNEKQKWERIQFHTPNYFEEIHNFNH